MTWVRLDDATPLHPKLLRAGAEAAWLWVAGLAYANRHVTDGAIPVEALPALYPGDEWPRAKLLKLAAKLVEVRLWVASEGGGWRIHDYGEYQAEAMRDAVSERREWEKTRKREQRARRKQSDSGDLSQRDRGGTRRRDIGGTEPRDTHGTSAGHDPGTSQGLSQPPGPARPVPTQISEARAGAPPQTPAPLATPAEVAAARPRFARATEEP